MTSPSVTVPLAVATAGEHARHAAGQVTPGRTALAVAYVTVVGFGAWVLWSLYHWAPFLWLAAGAVVGWCGRVLLGTTWVRPARARCRCSHPAEGVTR